VTTDSPRERAIIAVVSSKGGVGRTMLATNLATVTSRSVPTVLIDGDSYCGDVELALGLKPVWRLDDIVTQSSTNPEFDPISMLTRCGSGLSVACAPKNPFIADQMESRATWGVIRTIIDDATCAIFDTGPGLGPVTISAMDIATHILIMCGTDTASVNAARTLLGVIDQMSMDKAKVSLVVNRPAPKAGLRIADVTAVLGMEPTAVIGDDSAVATSMNKGMAVVDMAANSPASKSIVTLAATLLAHRQPDSSLSSEGES
jgi:pilus assembly protein CpaE